VSLRICREGILKLKPYIPGKPIEEVQREYGVESVIKLASNENPLGPSQKAVEAMKQAAEKVNIYPDGNCFALRNAVAAHLGVGPDCLSFGAGSDEVIHVIGLAFLEEGDEVLIADPTFSQYETASVLNECPCCKVALENYTHDLDAMAEQITERTKLVFIANPNNPTGTMVTHEQIENLLSKMPERATLVLDEAYTEYIERDDFPRGLEWVREGRNVIILRTFSKIYGLAGLRIGYGIARPEIISYLERVRQPFNVNSIAQAAAIASLADQDHVAKSRQLNSAGKKYFYQQFDRLGLPFAPSEGNFVWVDLNRDSVQVFRELLRRGVIIRTGDIFGMPTHARVTVGLPEENARFIAALEEVIS
jgi:histidinol-phosphate aminotransferase